METSIDLASTQESCAGEKKKSNQSQSVGKKRRKIDVACKSAENTATYFAETFFNKVKKRLSEEDFDKLMKLLVDYDNSSDRNEAELYNQVSELFNQLGSPDLAEDFVCFISPKFAKMLNKFEEANTLRSIWSTFNSIDSYHFGKMIGLLDCLAKSKGEVKASDVESTLRPLFKQQPGIIQALCQIFPSAKPIPCDVSSYEKVLDLSSDKDVEYEHVDVPRGQTDRACQGAACQCPCHSHSPKPLCSVCNIRFINGRIYVQRGKEIRSARVNFSYGVTTDEMQRKLHPLYYAQLQALAHSQPKNSPHKVERKDRKQSQSEGSGCSGPSKSESKVQQDSCKTDLAQMFSFDNLNKSSSSSKTGGKSGGGLCQASVDGVFYRESDTGHLEFYTRVESDSEHQLDDLDLSLSDTELHYSASDTQSSPSRSSPGKSNGSSGRSGGANKKSKSFLNAKRFKK